MAPGLDMLFAADWEKADIQPLLTEIDLPPLTGLPAGEGKEPARAGSPPAEKKAPGERTGPPPAGRQEENKKSSPTLPAGFGRIVLITLAVLAAALGGLAVFFLKGKGGGA